MNNVLLVAAMAVILLGTLYPIFLDAFDLRGVSVGPPYFSAMFLVPMLPLVFLLAPGMHAAWKRASFERTKVLLAVLLLAALVLGIGIPVFAYGWRSVLSAVGIVFALWVAFAALVEPIERLRKGHSLSAGVLGMSVAHFGLAMFILGATTVESYKQEKDLSLRPGQSTEVAGFTFTMNSLRDVAGPNYEAVESEVVISRNGKEIDEAASAEARLSRAEERDDRSGHRRRLESRPVRRDGRAARRRRVEPAPAVQADGALHLAGRARHRASAASSPCATGAIASASRPRPRVRRRPAPARPKHTMWRFIIPIGLFAALAAFLFIGLGRDKQTLPSPLIGKPAPQFELPRVDDPSQKISNREFAGRPYVVNIWGSWCVGVPRGARGADGDRAPRRSADRRPELEGRAAAGAALAAGARQSVRRLGVRSRGQRRHRLGRVRRAGDVPRRCARHRRSQARLADDGRRLGARFPAAHQAERGAKGE